MFWRVHWKDCPGFSPENASSAPWGLEEVTCDGCRGSGYIARNGREMECPWCEGTGVKPVERLLGYSCCSSRQELIDYFRFRCEPSDDTPVVIFAGEAVGLGDDMEPLVVPKTNPRPRWTTWGKLKRTAKMKGD